QGTTRPCFAAPRARMTASWTRERKLRARTWPIWPLPPGITIFTRRMYDAAMIMARAVFALGASIALLLAPAGCRRKATGGLDDDDRAAVDAGVPRSVTFEDVNAGRVSL